eukprot:167901-Pelagomonas_calceolata.AAC.1
MRIGRVVRSAPRCPDSPSPVVNLCRAWQLDLKARDLALCFFQSNGGFGVWTEFQLDKVDIPVLRRDLGRIK